MLGTLEVLDRSQLRDITSDDEALMREILSALLSDVAQTIDLLYRAIEQIDTKACRKLAHCSNRGMWERGRHFYRGAVPLGGDSRCRW
jgi:hypothetical protein